MHAGLENLIENLRFWVNLRTSKVYIFRFLNFICLLDLADIIVTN